MTRQVQQRDEALAASDKDALIDLNQILVTQQQAMVEVDDLMKAFKPFEKSNLKKLLHAKFSKMVKR